MRRVATLQHMLIKKGFAQHFVAMTVKGVEQAVLTARQPGPLHAVAHVAGAVIQKQLVLNRRRHGQNAGSGRAIKRHPPQNGGNTHLKLGHAERLGQVVIGAQLKTIDTVSLRAQRRHQNHRQCVGLAQLREHMQAIHAG